MASTFSQPLHHASLLPHPQFVTAHHSLFSGKSPYSSCWTDSKDGGIVESSSSGHLFSTARPPRNSTSETTKLLFSARILDCSEENKSTGQEGNKKIIWHFRRPNGRSATDGASVTTQKPEAAASEVTTEQSAAAGKNKRRRSSVSCSLTKEEIEEDLRAIATVKPSRRAVEAAEKKKQKKKPFSVALSKEEIAEDFKAIGLKLPGKPTKRDKKVQKKIDSLFPGLSLGSITENSYKLRASRR